MSRHLLRSTPGLAAALTLAAAAAGCAAHAIRVPEGPGAPVADAAAVIDQAAAGCRGVRTLQAELGVSGRAGSQKLRGRVIAGFERPSSMRLEAVAPFGPPVFILVARAGSATLLMPRDDRILADAPPAPVIEALTGVSVTPDDLLAVLAGCVTSDQRSTSARTYANGWAAVEVADGTTIYLRRQGQGWQIVAGTRGPLGVEYGGRVEAVPSRVRLRVSGSEGSVVTDLVLTVSQVQINGPIDPRAFALRATGTAAPLTLDELRRAGPLGERR